MACLFVHNAGRALIFGLSACVSVTSHALAQDQPGEQTSQVERRQREQRAGDRRLYGSEGVWEVGGSATFQHFTPVVNGVTGSAVTNVTASPYVGWFLLDGLAVGAYPAGLALVRGGGNTVTELRFFAAPSYTYRGRLLVYPFIEGLAGYAVEIRNSSGTDETRSGFSWGGRAGVKIPLTERGLLVLGGQYLAITLDPSGATGRNGSNEISATAGFTVWF